MDKKILKQINKGEYKPKPRMSGHKPSMLSKKEKIAEIAKKMKKK